MQKAGGTLKWIVLLLIAIICSYYYQGPNSNYNLALATVVPLVVAILFSMVVLFLVRTLKKRSIEFPIRMHGQSDIRKIESIVFLFSAQMIAIGVCLIVKETITRNDCSQIGLLLSFSGLGGILGLRISAKRKHRQYQ